MNVIFRLWHSLFPKEQVIAHMNPYRTAAEMPQEKPEPKPKKKREFKVDIKLGKHAKTFGYVVPVCASFIGMGLLYDAPLLGLGIKWGAALALGVMVVFFSIMAIAHADKAQSDD